MNRTIDLRSDTFTKPTPEMRNAMRDAEVGDDYYCEDPTVRRLQEIGANILGKEAGLFVTSGTMGNVVSVYTLTRPGDVIIAETDAHIIRSERGQLGAIAGVQPKTVNGRLGIMDPRGIEEALGVFPEETCHPNVTLIFVENTHNAAGGTYHSIEDMRAIRSIAERYGLHVCIDGARIFNAAVAQQVDVKDLAKDADVVTFCLSKGLCCPFGSLLVGTHEFIREARSVRQMLGGGMRQAGIMAAAGIVALEHMVDRLAEDHENAKLLAEKLVDLGFLIDIETVQTNMVFISGGPHELTLARWVKGLGNYGIVVGSPSGGRVRLVTHYNLTRSDISRVIDVTSTIVAREKSY